MYFFDLNFLNVRDILAQKIYIACTFLNHFSDVKNKGRSQQPSILGHWVTSEPQRTPTQQTWPLQAHCTWQKCLVWTPNFLLVINSTTALYCLAGPLLMALVALGFIGRKVFFFSSKHQQYFCKKEFSQLFNHIHHCLCPMFLFLRFELQIKFY